MTVQQAIARARFSLGMYVETTQAIHGLRRAASYGGTLFLLAQVASRTAKLMSLDIADFHESRCRLYRSFADGRQEVVLFRGDSQRDETRQAVQEFFGEEPLDVLFIDGDHSYEAVRRDYEMYAPLVRPGGLIGLHDIVPGPEELVGGVPRFWRELADSLPETDEIVADWDQGGWGIGVVVAPSGTRRETTPPA